MKNVKYKKVLVKDRLCLLLAVCIAITLVVILPLENVYASDSDTVSIVAGIGIAGFSGDGGAAVWAQLNFPRDIAIDSKGNIYIAESDNKRIRKIDAIGNISTFAGDGTTNLKNNESATSSGIGAPYGVVVDCKDNVYIAVPGYNMVRKIDTNGIITTIAGGNHIGYSGDEGPATAAQLDHPNSVEVDSSGDIYIADTRNHCIRKIDTATGIINTIAGNGSAGYFGDGGPATAAKLNYPSDVAVDSSGNIYVADGQNNVVRKIDAITGKINTIAGNGIAGYSGDGGNAKSATLNYPTKVEIDGKGNIYIVLPLNSMIRKIDTNGIISTVAVHSSAGPFFYEDVAADSEGDLYMSDNNHQITKLLFGRTISGNVGVEGATISYTEGIEKTVITDDTGAYSFKVPYNWTGTLTLSKAGYTFLPDNKSYSNVTVDQTAQNFTANAVNYEVSIDVTMGGSITATPTTTVAGDTVNLTVTPDNGNRLKVGTLKYNDGIDHNIIGTEFTMPSANVTVSAEFEEIPVTTYTVSIGVLAGGSITAAPTTTGAGFTVNLTVTPDSGKRLKEGTLKYNDGTNHNIIGTEFTMPTANVIVSAEFEEIPKAVTPPNINPISANYDLTASSDVYTIITWGDAKSVIDVIYGNENLIFGTDYMINENTLTIYASYLESMHLNQGDSIDFDIFFNDNSLCTLTVNVVEGYIHSHNANLNELQLNAGTLNPVFSADIVSYSVSVGSSVSSINITPVVSDINATVTINGTSVTSGSAISISLNKENNIVDIIVTAENGSTKKYTITVNRVATSDGGGKTSQSTYTPIAMPKYNAVISGASIGKSTLQVTVDSNTSIAEVDTETMDGDLFSDEKMTIITMPSISGVNDYTLKIPEASLSVSQGDSSLNFSTEIGSIIIPDNMLIGISGTKGKKVGITIGQGNKSMLQEDVKIAIGNRPLVQFTMTLDGVQTEWNNSNAPVAVSIPYTPTATELADHEHIVIWYIDSNGKAVSVSNGRYDPTTGMVNFTATHFSHYAVAYVVKTFNDLESVTWAKTSIEVLASKGVLKGMTEKEYAPNSNITRADFLYSLARALDLDAKIDANFDDIKSDSYYYKEIAVAKKLGITSGIGNNKFNPDASITRQEMMVLTGRALSTLQKLKIQGTDSDLNMFADKDLIDGYAIDNVATIVRENLIVGSGDNINPLGNTTRAEAAVFLYRIYNKF